ncbi:MAG: hypothetical protein HY776_07610 [Actinobacteria bacterium]|nr:hypothetical protein [Actinomycetota bacterium]
MFFIYFLSAFLLSYLILPLLLSFLKQAGYTRENFSGKLIPVGSGILIPLIFLILLFFDYLVFKKLSDNKLVLPFLIAIIGMSFLGLLDDLFGDRSIGGFKGHFGKLKEGHITTGVLKALGGGVLSLFIVRFFTNNIVINFLDALLMALFINIFNLLDTRPGRTLKVFLFLSLIIFIIAFKAELVVLMALFIGIALALIKTDLSGRSMMGDVGSNSLGAIIGLSFVIVFNIIAKVIFLILLILIHLFTEKHSITETISKIKFLDYLDRLGRKEPGVTD